MSVALTYTKPVCLFELYNGGDASQGSASDIHAEARGVPDHNAALLRQLSDESIKDRRKLLVTCDEGIDRCGNNDELGWALYRCCTMQQFLIWAFLLAPSGVDALETAR